LLNSNPRSKPFKLNPTERLSEHVPQMVVYSDEVDVDHTSFSTLPDVMISHFNVLAPVV
jgi:hypothetical protein